MLPEEAALLLLLLTGGVAWALWVAAPVAVKYKAMRMGLHDMFNPIFSQIIEINLFCFYLFTLQYQANSMRNGIATHKNNKCKKMD